MTVTPTVKEQRPELESIVPGFPDTVELLEALLLVFSGAGDCCNCAA